MNDLLFYFTNSLEQLNSAYNDAVQLLVEAARERILIPFCDNHGLKFEGGYFFSNSSEQPIHYDKDTGYPNMLWWRGDKDIPSLPLELLEVLNSTTLGDGRSIWITMKPYTPASFCEEK